MARGRFSLLGEFFRGLFFYHEKYEKTRTFHVTLRTEERCRVVDCFDKLFIDESCERTDSRISLFSLFEGKSYAEAWGCQGGTNRIGWRYGLIGGRSGAIFGWCRSERLRSAATRRHTSGTDADVGTDYLEKKGLNRVHTANKWRVFRCTVNWARARLKAALIAVGAAGSRGVFSVGVIK
ncbi:hypothetical protein Pan161_29660 [Gimesia algae]|uniref:Uncharacterized protein n=1 Tax=Gimesia algae TaxID=2527971 RepID=A0A517VE89_9PLAN|nr:hypothetical protein Pan161_29660 [Gimesia algae]